MAGWHVVSVMTIRALYNKIDTAPLSIYYHVGWMEGVECMNFGGVGVSMVEGENVGSC
jgi:hypothetical protein